MWTIFYLLVLLLAGSCVGITVKKIKNDIYHPYYLRPILITYTLVGLLFFVASFILFLQI
ncbi:MAG: hypothetical protein ACD_28C00346G0003 [uncultured bacterium]|nr:MAG: hypothetical protein ACD_28C00346G0003 [uncultured bacterium]